MRGTHFDVNHSQKRSNMSHFQPYGVRVMLNIIENRQKILPGKYFVVLGH